MRLVQQICQRCIEETCTKDNRWKFQDDDRWSRGTIYCPKELSLEDHGEIPIDRLPHWCPFTAEHLVSQC